MEYIYMDVPICVCMAGRFGDLCKWCGTQAQVTCHIICLSNEKRSDEIKLEYNVITVV